MAIRTALHESDRYDTDPSSMQGNAMNEEWLDRDVPANSESMARAKRSPLPKFQLFITLLIQVVEPVAGTVIYPFVNQMVRETGITDGDDRKTGYFAGIIQSAFFLGESLSVVYWGFASDRIGRRPILLLGPFGVALMVLGFGLTHNYWPLVVSRAVQGVFNGNIGVTKTVMAEVTDSTNLADALALIPLMWSFGTTIGPVIGGTFSRPATTWPDIFGNVSFFADHPYFLPCALTSVISLLAGLTAFFGLKETLPAAIDRQNAKKNKFAPSGSHNRVDAESRAIVHGQVVDYGSVHQETHQTNGTYTSDSRPAELVETAPPLRTLLNSNMLIVLTNYIFLSFTEMAFEVLLPLMYSTSISLGGLGLEPYDIGMILGAWGLFNAFVQVGLLARLIRRFGPKRVHIVCYICNLFVISAFPVLSFLAKRTRKVDGLVWMLIALQLAFAVTNLMAYGSIHIIIVDIAPNKSSLGAMNGLAQMLGSGTRAIAPSVASSLFSISLQKRLAGGNLVYIILITIVVIGIRLTFLLPEKATLP